MADECTVAREVMVCSGDCDPAGLRTSVRELHQVRGSGLPTVGIQTDPER